MKCALLCAALLLGRFVCSVTHVEDDGEDRTRIVVVSNPQLGPVAAFVFDADGDGRVDVWAAGTLYHVRAEGLEVVPDFPAPEGDAPERLAILEDRDGDGAVDRILVDGALFWDRYEPGR